MTKEDYAELKFLRDQLSRIQFEQLKEKLKEQEEFDKMMNDMQKEYEKRINGQ